MAEGRAVRLERTIYLIQSAWNGRGREWLSESHCDCYRLVWTVQRTRCWRENACRTLQKKKFFFLRKASISCFLPVCPFATNHLSVNGLLLQFVDQFILLLKCNKNDRHFTRRPGHHSPSWLRHAMCYASYELRLKKQLNIEHRKLSIVNVKMYFKRCHFKPFLLLVYYVDFDRL